MKLAMRAKAFLAWLAAILASGPAASTESNAEERKCVESLRRVIRVTKVDLQFPVSYEDAVSACRQYPGTHLPHSIVDLSSVEPTLCGDQLVPLAEETSGLTDFLDSLSDTPFPDDAPSGHPAAIFSSSGEWLNVNDSHEFSCVLCQHDDVKFPHVTAGFWDDSTTSEHFVVHLASVNTRDTDEVGEDEKARLRKELDGLLKPNWGLNHTQFNRSWFDDTKHLHIEFWVASPISLTVTTGSATTSILNGSFVMSVEDVDVCPAGETVDADGVVTQWPAMATTEEFRFTTHLNTHAISRRDCRFNYDNFRGEWDPQLSRWELVWRECTSDEKYINEDNYKQFLDAVDIDRRHANVLQGLASTPINTTLFQEVARLVNREVNARNELYEQTERYLVDITANLVMDSGSDYSMVALGRVDLIVADLGGSEPVVGFALQFNITEKDPIDIVTLNRNRTVEGRAPFALDVSSRLAEAHSRMAFVVVWKYIPSLASSGENNKHFQYMEVTVMFPRQGEVSAWTFASYGNHHVDITYNTEMILDNVRSFYLVCVAWSNDLRDWTKEGCKTLYGGNFSACRCSGKYFALKDGVPIAKYALKHGLASNISLIQNNIFTDFLKDKIALMTATAIECLLSLLGLGSIIATAILFKEWRENAGHKILLHMVLALTCNLVLGFIANFMRMKAEGVGCLVYGVLRHYSFLAMFLWMLVLSLLQMKRLMTVAGAKATTHLVLKVSVFAWGVPWVPVVVLLAWNPGFYQTDRFERGYCYPEGLVFHLTVQWPAGLILLVNFGIFVNIVLNIFGCVGASKIKRHSKNERAEQLNKLKTSIFIFFLFGFTWVFHILSEERVIVSDFLFEYLFLMTATTHIFALALFFVLFQDNTRKDWINVISQRKKEKSGITRGSLGTGVSKYYNRKSGASRNVTSRAV